MQIFPDLLLPEESESTPSFQSQRRAEGDKPVFISTLGPFSPHQKVPGAPGNSRYFDKAGQCSGLVGQSRTPRVNWHCRHVTAGTVSALVMLQ